jgi:hypothetical protein
MPAKSNNKPVSNSLATQANPSPRAVDHNDRSVSPDDIDRLEFFRHGVALMAGGADRFPAIAYMVEAHRERFGHRFCSCRKSGKATCEHLKTLARVHRAYVNPNVAKAGEISNRSWNAPLVHSRNKTMIRLISYTHSDL